MEYYIKVDGRAYQLPARTLEVDEAIDRIIHGRDRLRAGEITRRQLRGEQRDFITLCTGEQLPPLEEMDMTDLELAALALVDFYLSPAKTIYPNI
jgi:hypothetical protein